VYQINQNKIKQNFSNTKSLLTEQERRSSVHPVHSTMSRNTGVDDAARTIDLHTSQIKTTLQNVGCGSAPSPMHMTNSQS